MRSGKKWSKAARLCLVWPFLAFPDFPPVLPRFCFQTQMSSSWQLASELSILYFLKKGSRHYSEVLKAEALHGEQIFVRAIFEQAILPQSKEHFFAFFAFFL